MKPHVVLFTDVCDFIDGIKGSVDGGASGGVHKHRNIPLSGGKKTRHWLQFWAEFKLLCSFSLCDCRHQREHTSQIMHSSCLPAFPFLLVCTSLCLWRITSRRGTLNRGSITCADRSINLTEITSLHRHTEVFPLLQVNSAAQSSVSHCVESLIEANK